VLIHPLGGPDHSPASLPSDPCLNGEEPQIAAIRIVKEKTGLDVEISREFTTFIQEGTPTGTMCAHGYVATVTVENFLLMSEGRRRPIQSMSCPPLFQCELPTDDPGGVSASTTRRRR